MAEGKLAVRILAMASALETAAAATLAGLPAVPPADKDHPGRVVASGDARSARVTKLGGAVGLVRGAVQRRPRLVEMRRSGAAGLASKRCIWVDAHRYLAWLERFARSIVRSVEASSRVPA